MIVPLCAVIIINIIAGAANTLVASGMNKVVAVPSFGASAKEFSHPFVQTLIMMIGEGSCLLVFAIIYWRTSRSNPDPERTSPWHRGQLLFAIPACFDWCATSMLYASMLDLPGSQVQMLRGSLVIFVFLISVFILRNKVHKHHYVGVMFVVLGIICLGLSATSKQRPDGDRKTNPFRGVVLCLMAQIVFALLLTSEEKIFKMQQTPAILAIGIEGCTGVLAGVVVLAATALLGVETPGEAAYQIFHSRTLFVTSIMLCISIASFNCTGVQITKSISATARSTVDGLRTLLVWFGDMSFGWASTDCSSFAFWLQPIGFSITLLGTLIYFNTIAIPSLMGEEELAEYHGRMQQTREMQESNQAFLADTPEDDTLMPDEQTSPQTTESETPP